jgi:nanoRNase/pAp phosphatase (c-di-AMP/oligoRNAs hydrolase)
LGGGGHAAAAGCELPGLRHDLAERVAEQVGKQLA